MNRTAARQSQSIVGKTVSGVISRPAEGGREVLLMLQFTDGSCFEFVSASAHRALRRATGTSTARSPGGHSQLSFFPQDGRTGSAASAPACQVA